MPKNDSFSIQTPSRIHFGLFGGPEENGLSYGGLGAMVDKPGLELCLEPHTERKYVGNQSDRLRDFVEKWLDHTGISPDSELKITLKHAPPSHVGLGTGTQLGLAVSALLYRFFFDEIPSVSSLAKSVGRGQRSAIGTYGFQHGGFIVDSGKKTDDQLANLDFHCDIPPAWRFLLLHTAHSVGLAGAHENEVFRHAKNRMANYQQELIKMTQEKILPALLQEDFDTFSDTIYQFGRTSGSYFADIQGGPYNGKRITELITLARELGVKGAGQSSWGPNIYLLARSELEAVGIASKIQDHLLPDESILIATPQNHGFSINTGLPTV